MIQFIIFLLLIGFFALLLGGFNSRNQYSGGGKSHNPYSGGSKSGKSYKRYYGGKYYEDYKKGDFWFKKK
jgi:hypothetical protein